MTPYKVAIIGLGRMGSTIDDEGHFEVPYSVAAATKASTRLELVAGADLQSEKRDAFSERWNVAVYEDFRDDLLAAPRPTGLSAEAGQVYDELLADRTRQFLEKAAIDYREVLSLTQLLRLEDAWIEVIRSALARCEEELQTGFTASAGPLPSRVPGDG